MHMQSYGWNPEMYPSGGEGDLGRITAVHRERYELVSEQGEGFARLKTSAYLFDDEPIPTAGDFVRFLPNPYGDGLILHTLPRRTFFSRRDPQPGGKEQAVAANFDVVFLVQSMNHDFSLPRLERYAAIALSSSAETVILLTKSDLADDPARYTTAVRQRFPNIAVHALSTCTAQGLDALTAYLTPGKTAVLLGSSGVGKSTLINALAGQEIMSTAAIREDDSKGRHTTTHRQLLMLPSGAMVIDTPGMRQIGLWDARDGLDMTFADVESFLGQCRFRDCRHQGEPGCAINNALTCGELDPDRWARYVHLQQENRYAEDRNAALADKRERFRRISKENKRHRNR